MKCFYCEIRTGSIEFHKQQDESKRLVLILYFFISSRKTQMSVLLPNLPDSASLSVPTADVNYKKNQKHTPQIYKLNQISSVFYQTNRRIKCIYLRLFSAAV